MSTDSEGFRFTWEDAPLWEGVNKDLIKFAVDAGLVHSAVFNVMDNEQVKHLCEALEGIYQGSDGDTGKVSWIGM